MDPRLPGLEPAMKRLKQSPPVGCEPIWSRGGPQYSETRMANSTSLSTSTTRLRGPTSGGVACSNPLSTTAPQGHLLGQSTASGFTFSPSHPQQWQLPSFDVSTLPAWFSHISQPHLPGSYQYVPSPQQSGLMEHPSGQPSLYVPFPQQSGLMGHPSVQPSLYVPSPQQSGLMGHPSGQPSLYVPSPPSVQPSLYVPSPQQSGQPSLYVPSHQQSGLMGHPSGQPSLLGGLPWSVAPATAAPSRTHMYPNPSNFHQPPLLGRGLVSDAQQGHAHGRTRRPPRPMVEIRPELRVANSATISVVSYNVLAQDLIGKNPYLYSHCPPEMLQWEYRRENILAELLLTKADILCLQEVEEEHYHSWFKDQLASHNYESVYQKRTGSHKDGCAIFYLTTRLSLLEWSGVEYQRQVKVLNRDNIGLIGKFEVNRQQPEKRGRNSSRASAEESSFCVATTHLLFNPKAGEVKLAQLSCLLAELHQLASPPVESGRRLLPCILCGDLNSTPNSPLVDFIGSSRLDYSSLSAVAVAGYFQGRDKKRQIPVPLLPAHLHIGPDCKYVQNDTDSASGTSKMEISSCETPIGRAKVNASSDSSSLQHSGSSASNIDYTHSPSQPDVTPHCLYTNTGSQQHTTTSTNSHGHVARITHPFNFSPAYPHSTSQGQHPSTITTYHQSAFETVDYIYFTPSPRRWRRSGPSPGFRLLNRRALPSTHTLLDLGPQPHQSLSSDHLLLQADLQFFW